MDVRTQDETISHSDPDWERSLRNFTHFSDVDELITAVADRQQDLFDRDLPRLMNRLFRCNGCDPDHPIDLQQLLERNTQRLLAKPKPAVATLPPKKPKPVKR